MRADPSVRPVIEEAKMVRASTATVMASLGALLFGACSSGTEPMNPAPMAPNITQGGSGGSTMQVPPSNVPTSGAGGSTAPAPTAGMSTPTGGTPGMMMNTAGSDATPPPPQCMNCKIPVECQGFP